MVTALHTKDTLLEPIYVVPGYTFFYFGFTLPKRYYDSYASHLSLAPETLSSKIELMISRKTYPARIRIARITTKRFPNREVVQIFYDREYNTLKALRKLFIYSYATTIRKSKPKLKELMELEHLGGTTFKVTAASKQQTDFDEMLMFMEEKNLFDYWRDNNSRANDRFFVDFSNKWLPAKAIDKYRERVNVVYFLYSHKYKHLYVGKANKVGQRIIEGKGRVGLEEWDKFMYFEIDPKYAHAIEEIETYTIRAFASIFENDVKMEPLGEKVTRLVNRQLKAR